MYFAGGQVCETILIQKNRTEHGSMWILGPGSFKVIGLSKSQIQVSTILLIYSKFLHPQIVIILYLHQKRFARSGMRTMNSIMA